MSTDLQTYVTSVIGLALLRFLCAGAYHKRLAQIPCLFRPLSLGMQPIVRRKLHENMWYSLWHTMSFSANMYMLLQSNWFKPVIFQLDFAFLYRDHTLHPFEPYGRLFYLCSLGFWTSCMLFLGIETRRKDFIQMVLHHVLTVSLIAISYALNFHRFGLLVLLFHDVVDVFLYTAKCLIYKNYQTIFHEFLKEGK